MTTLAPEFFAMPLGFTFDPVFRDRDPTTRCGAMLWFFDNAAWKDGLSRQCGWDALSVAKGEVAASFHEMAACWSWSPGKARRFVYQMENAGHPSIEDGLGHIHRVHVTGYDSGGDDFPDDRLYPLFLHLGTLASGLVGPARSGLPAKTRSAVAAKTGGLCFYCRDELRDDFHVDHKRPLVSGGSDHFSNLVPACPRCNLSKGTLTAKQFIARRAGRAS